MQAALLGHGQDDVDFVRLAVAPRQPEGAFVRLLAQHARGTGRDRRVDPPTLTTGPGVCQSTGQVSKTPGVVG